MENKNRTIIIEKDINWLNLSRGDKISLHEIEGCWGWYGPQRIEETGVQIPGEYTEDEINHMLRFELAIEVK